jgi:multicomponent Na+:H+ antiporter subunit C
MSGALIVAVSALVGAGIFLITSRSLSRIVLGFALLGHAAVVSLLAAGGRAGAPPIAGSSDDTISDPLPQAFSLTAIVISFGLTLFVLALARRQQVLTGDDLVEDDIEDRRIAALADGDSDNARTDQAATPSDGEATA